MNENMNNSQDKDFSQSKFEIISSLANQLIYEYDVKTGNIHWNGAIQKITGFTSEEFQKVNIDIWTSLLHPKDAPVVASNLEKAMQEKREFYSIYRFKHKEGHYFYVRDRGIFIYNEEDQPEKMLGIMEDINEQKLTEDALMLSERKLSLFYSITNEGMLYLNANNYKIIETNKRLLEMFLYSKEEIVELTIFHLFPKEYCQRIQNWLTTHENQNLNISAIKKNGKIFPVIIKSLKENFQESSLIFLTILDVTIYQEAEFLKQAYEEISIKNKEIESKKSELEETLSTLRRAQKQLIFSEKMVALGQLISGVAHEINNPIGSIKASSEIIKENFIQWIEEHKNISKLLTELKEEELQNYFNWILENISTTEFIYGKRVYEIKAQISDYLNEIQAVQQEYLLENLVENLCTKKLDSVKFLFTNEKWVELWEFTFFLVGIARNLYIIENSVNRVSKIVFALKNFSRIKQDEVKSLTNIIKSIELVLTIYESSLKKGVEVIKEYEDIPDILCYADTIHQIWTNLIFNSLQAMNFRGTLKIRVRNLEDCISVSISDTGHGIPKEIQNKIFEPFFTTKKLGEGSGLGLSIVKTIVEQHEGKIEFSSSEGNTTFTVYLPKFFS